MIDDHEDSVNEANTIDELVVICKNIVSIPLLTPLPISLQPHTTLLKDGELPRGS
jgi:hypothetical protein